MLFETIFDGRAELLEEAEGISKPSTQGFIHLLPQRLYCVTGVTLF